MQKELTKKTKEKNLAGIFIMPPKEIKKAYICKAENFLIACFF